MSELLVVSIGLGIFGMVMGSFVGAMVWRLRAQQLVEDKANGEDYDRKEYKRLHLLTEHKGAKDRSRCLSCGHKLAWHDLIPLASWLSTRGRCRYCRASIGWFEPLLELSMATFFVGSFLFWPSPLDTTLALAQFGLWLVAGVMLGTLFAYDTKWFLLPDKVVFPLMAVALAFSLLGLVGEPSILSAVLNIGIAVGVLSGLYFVLWLVSQGRWIGFGDVKLGIILGLLLGSWQLALLTLFLANLIGTLIVLPGLLTKRLSRTTQVPFGPMLIAACVATVLFGQSIIDWYLSLVIL
jgi:prepilin signal peptidase PulO-like enzyme (type II secretory pathway)